MAPTPLPEEMLKEITVEACNSAFADATQYDHSKAAAWNNALITTVLHKLIEGTSAGTGPSQYKFIVNTTIIQHALPGDNVGKRGMYSASSAFWNNEKDGTWSLKWDGAESKGFDVVVMITWIGL